MHVDDPVISQLRDAALAAAKNAYCPYSKFPVGAAVLTENGEIFAGCNVENASFGLTICAERNAIFQAVASGHNRVRVLVVVTSTDQPTPPCGSCRQVINEFGEDAEVFSFGKGNQVLQHRLKELLPHAFGPKNLGR